MNRAKQLLMNRAKQLLMQTPWGYRIKRMIPSSRAVGAEWDVEFTYNGYYVGARAATVRLWTKRQAEEYAQKMLAEFKAKEMEEPFGVFCANKPVRRYVWDWYGFGP